MTIVAVVLGYIAAGLAAVHVMRRLDPTDPIEGVDEYMWAAALLVWPLAVVIAVLVWLVNRTRPTHNRRN